MHTQHRVMVQTQQLWVSELSSATGQHSYGTSRPAMRVELPEPLVGSCSLGQVVHIIGHAACSTSTAGPANAVSIHVSGDGLSVCRHRQSGQTHAHLHACTAMCRVC
jgi:hypothetical protein